jgi:hypothetical protein
MMKVVKRSTVCEKTHLLLVLTICFYREKMELGTCGADSLKPVL